jgi:glyoxylase-like metal-dependent hydrolase (beta-lactamase superfamily II)
VTAPPSLRVADRWFARTTVDDSITLLVEPHVIELMGCSIWPVRGRARDLVIDTGMGLVSVAAELADLTDLRERPAVAVATHGHDDHIGGHHEFAEVVAHPLEIELLRDPPLRSLSPREAWGDDAVDALTRTGYDLSAPWFVDALPAGLAVEGYHQRPVVSVRTVDEGDVIDLGDRAFEVLHLPGHSPGSIGLWEAATGTLFSGDAVYDGPLLDELPESSIADYCATMHRLLRLPVRVVHGGHDPSFDRARLHELARAYLRKRQGD